MVHGFSTRRVGTGIGERDVSGSDERDGFIAAVGLAGWPVGRLKQIHSNITHHVDDNEFANETPEGDAPYTGLAGMGLEIRTADCVPVLIASRDGQAVATAHAGWRGTSEGVVRQVVDSVVSRFSIPASELVVALGPHIGVCCMEVGEEVYEWFRDPTIFERKPGRRKPHLNLGEANRKQLLEAGVPSEGVSVSKLCTRCRGDLFHSYRRDGDGAGRMFAVIGIEP